MRGLTRHWWQILLVWLGVSAPVMYLIALYVEPTYEAVSILQVQPVTQELYGQARPETIDLRSVTPYLQTQVSLITTDRVLGAAIASPEVVNLTAITKFDDPKPDLRKNMVVEILKDAYLIRVALELTDGNQAAEIVNAVVHSYLAYHSEFKRTENATLRISLELQRKKIQGDIEKKRAELRTLYQKGNVEPPKTTLNVNATKNDNDNDATQPSFSNISERQSESLAEEMMRTELEIVKIDSDIKAQESVQMNLEDQGQQARQIDEQLEQRIRDEFRRDPEYIALSDEIISAEEQRDHAKSLARRANDPARRATEQKCKNLRDQYDELWQAKHKEIGERLKTAMIGSQSQEAINDLKIKLKSLKAQKEKQAKLFEAWKGEKKVVNNDTFEATFVHRQLEILLKSDDRVKTNLEELQFKADLEDYRVSQLDKAVAPKTPSNNKRIKYMAAAPLALLFMVLGLFFLLEVKAERIADPDTLSTRVRSEVYALPPLPTPRSIRRLKGPDADDQIEQFIQRLDHLRFAVCGNPSELGKGRCVLITSAVGGEGKTTLAAQLAARCGNAGMSTLLIDADLRRASLCPLLDVPEGPGLSDVLKEEATADEVIIPVQGGTFYLLPAGTPIQDNSRVFQSRNLGVLITQLRQLYDLIIIDSPPVLPVPDALILGRWADGAVLAARYDISRFPQVERARRQLDNAGIAIMGTVINGMRNADSYYGRYSYGRRRSPQPSSSDTI